MNARQLRPATADTGPRVRHPNEQAADACWTAHLSAAERAALVIERLQVYAAGLDHRQAGELPPLLALLAELEAELAEADHQAHEAMRHLAAVCDLYVRGQRAG